MKRNVSDLLTKIEEKTGLSLKSVRDMISEEQAKPLSAAIFGQTGCGKSSLTNAIFGTDFDVDDVKPCTKEPQSHASLDPQGNKIVFWDLPGIGESSTADARYIDLYAQYAASCDVVLWAFQADTRTMTLDAAALNSIVERLGAERKGAFLDRLTVVVTKADLVSPGPWIFAKSGRDAIIATSRETEDTLDRKSTYFYESLLSEHQADVVHRTYVSSRLDQLRSLPKDFWLDDGEAFLCHRGTLDRQKTEYLSQNHPGSIDELSRLHEQSRAVVCSARYKFNLNGVKAKIAQKSRGKSMLRLSQSVTTADGRLPWDELKTLGLPVFFDQSRNKVIFNIEKT
jgi:uncharacterized protein